MKIIHGSVYTENAGFVEQDIKIKGEQILSLKLRQGGGNEKEILTHKEEKLFEDGRSVNAPLADEAASGSREAEETVIDATGCYVIPGLMDIHFHGCAGYDLCDGSVEAIKAIAAYQAKVGVTSILPATMTLPKERLATICRAAASYVKEVQITEPDAEDVKPQITEARMAEAAVEDEKQQTAKVQIAELAAENEKQQTAKAQIAEAAAEDVKQEMAETVAGDVKPQITKVQITEPDAEDEKLQTVKTQTAAQNVIEMQIKRITAREAVFCGIHMEGPFVSEKKLGAQNPAYLQMPDQELFDELQKESGNLIRLVDLAPELLGAMEFIEKNKKQVIISLAHTIADYDTATEAFQKGASHVTHLFNAMPPFGHRQPGAVGAAADAGAYAELICDGVHIHPSMVRSALKLLGEDKIIFISDSMMATGLADGTYSLGGQPVQVKGRLATLNDGTIAGSVTNLMECVKRAVLEMNIPLTTAVKCAAVNPAKHMGFYEKYGSIEPGKVANLVLLEKETLNVKRVILRGTCLI